MSKITEIKVKSIEEYKKGIKKELKEKVITFLKDHCINVNQVNFFLSLFKEHLHNLDLELKVLTEDSDKTGKDISFFHVERDKLCHLLLFLDKLETPWSWTMKEVFFYNIEWDSDDTNLKKEVMICVEDGVDIEQDGKEILRYHYGHFVLDFKYKVWGDK